MSKPNVIVFFSDQQRWDTVEAYRDTPIATDADGRPAPVMPNLTQMASEGTRFEHAYTCQPVCGPVRACLQTGKYAAEVGCQTNHRRLPPEEKTVAQLMTAEGYETGYIGKWHLASCGPHDGDENFREKPVPPDRRGGYNDFWLAADVLEYTSHSYDGFMYDGDGNRRDFPEGRYRVDAITDWVVEYLDSRSLEKPFFLFLSYIEPHHQNDHHCFEGPRGSKEKYANFEVPGDLVDTEGDWRREFPDYLGCINALDNALGRVRAKLEERGIADNTVLIYASDHGSHFCTRNGEYKRSCHDSSIRVPMVATGPGFKGGNTVSGIASLIDIPTTILSAGGAEIPTDMRGGALQQLVDGTAENWPEEAFVQISESQCGRAIRTKDWTYSVRSPTAKSRDAGSDLYEEDFLYDMTKDPHQRNNLVADPAYKGVRERMAMRLLKRMVAAGEKAPKIVPKSQED